MEHNDIRHKLSEYIDGSLTERERSDVEVHLKTCLQCSDALSELRITIEHIKAVEDIEPPAWMTRKIMANMRAETAAKKGLFERFFLPLSIKLPIQAVAIVFLTVTAFYMYRNIQPASVPFEAPVQEFASGNGPARDRLAKADDRALHAKQVPQAPEYKSLDMKLEYEKSVAPKPMDKAEAPAPAKAEGQSKLHDDTFVGKGLAKAPVGASTGYAAKAQEESVRTSRQERDEQFLGLSAETKAKTAARAPAKPAKQPMLAKEEDVSGKIAAAPQAGALAMMQEATPSIANVSQADAKRKSAAASRGGSTMHEDQETIISARYQDGTPKVIETYKTVDSHRFKLAEEQFNSSGKRHGIHQEYYASGQLKVKAEYDNGKMNWYMEFMPDGTKKIGNSDFNWYWLKK